VLGFGEAKAIVVVVQKYQIKANGHRQQRAGVI
jgi:hypothetical protein